ncbi:MAG: ubiquinone biosynthesis protein [Gammaproteobacteria bacterium]|nr:ubiquinone biosynthesis protein [Gammaproteobacteria bacterium]
MTVPLGLALLYWLMVIVGAADIDIFDFDTDLPEEAGGFGGFLATTGLTGVPTMVAFSIPILWGWLFTVLGTGVLKYLVTGGAWFIVGGVLVLLASLFMAVLISALMIRPLRHYFKTENALHQTDIVGKVCVVKTLNVDEGFGQAEFEDGGAGLLIQVRSETGNGLTKGSKALIIARDEQKEAFRVRSYDDSAEVAVLENN